MRVDLSATVMTGLIATLSLSSCSGPRDTNERAAVDRSADETAIRSLLAANWAASSARNAEGVAATYLPDGDAWIAGLPRVSGFADVHRLEEEFGGMPGFQRYDGTIDSIRFISRDSAIVEVSGITIMDTGNFDEEVTIVVARKDGEWRIAAFRVMTFDETLLSILRE